LKMKTAALYARYSTDLQNDHSIEDQFALCRALAKREKLAVTETFADRAKTSATMFDRDGLLALLKQARERKFDVVIVEAINRISRDQEDLAHVFKRLTYNKVAILTQSGFTTETEIGVHGIVGPIFRRNLADSVRRHHSARAREGKVPGAIRYGYRAIPGKPSEREADPETAAVVIRIFNETAEGRSPRNIAIDLSCDGIPSPSGDSNWNHQTLTQARSGILRNELYIGRLVWNKRTNDRNPDTGKITKPAASPDDVIVTDVPHMRIIDQGLWDRAQEAIKARAPTHPGARVVPRTDHILAGLLRCCACGSHMRVARKTRAGHQMAMCAAADARNACDHRRSYDMERLLADIINGMETRLMDQAALVQLTKGFHEWAKQQKQDRGADSIKKQLTRVQVQIDRLVALVTDSEMPLHELGAKLKALEAERVGLVERLRLAEAESNVIAHPAAIETYRANVQRLVEALTVDGGANDPATRAAFRNIIDCIVLHPTKGFTPYEFTPYGRLAAMGGVELFPATRSTSEIIRDYGCDNVYSENMEISPRCNASRAGGLLR
jgi:site-specific DNA recombinase